MYGNGPLGTGPPCPRGDKLASDGFVANGFGIDGFMVEGGIERAAPEA